MTSPATLLNARVRNSLTGVGTEGKQVFCHPFQTAHRGRWNRSEPEARTDGSCHCLYSSSASNVPHSHCFSRNTITKQYSLYYYVTVPSGCAAAKPRGTLSTSS